MRVPIVYTHIPKTGGSTLRDIVRRQYGAEHVFSIRAFTPERLRREMKTFEVDPGRHAWKAISGHAIVGAHQFVSDSYSYITMVREPIDRVISDYYYVCRTPDHDFYDPVVTEKYSLADYVESGITIYARNLQTRMLSGLGREVPYDESPSSMLKKAKKNIDTYFSVIGLTESFNQSVILMKHRLGWGIPVYKTRNKTRKRPKRDEVSQSTREIIQEHNELDIKLYEYASERFQRQLSEERDGAFDRDLRYLRILNTMYAPSVRAYIHLRNAYNRLLGRDSW